MKITVVVPAIEAGSFLETFGLRPDTAREHTVGRVRVSSQGYDPGTASFEIHSYLDYLEIFENFIPASGTVFLYDEIPLNAKMSHPKPGIYYTYDRKSCIVVSGRSTPGGTVISIEGRFKLNVSQVREIWKKALTDKLDECGFTQSVDFKKT